MSDVHIHHLNHAFMKIQAEPSIIMEIADGFTFFKDNYRFDPKYKARMWDGKISLVNRLSATCYSGLFHKIVEFCQKRGYTVTWDKIYNQDNIERNAIEKFVRSLDLPDWLEIRDYQLDAIHKCAENKRLTLLSPTSCHIPTDKIWTSKGLQEIQDVKVGDAVYGMDGELKEVLSIHEGDDDLYKICPKIPGTFTPFTVTHNHVLLLKCKDGSTTQKDAYSVYMSASQDNSYKLIKNNYVLDDFTKNIPFYTQHDYYIVGTQVEDRIPLYVFELSANERNRYISGIIDTYGEEYGRGIIVRGKSLNFNNDLNKLCVSLGYACTQKDDGIVIHIDDSDADVEFSIQYEGKGEYYGLTVEDSFYLTESGIITHNSGKSFIMYCLARWHNKKTLIIVPSVGLITQLQSDFISYGYKGNIVTSIGGLNRSNNIDCDVCITTWQSLDNGKTSMPKAWFDQFEVVMGDECHGAKSSTLIKILKNMENTPYRYGVTGTLDNNILNQNTIEGLFGRQYKTTTTRELIDSGYASDIKIKCIVLRYPESIRKEFNSPIKDAKTGKTRKRTYEEEIEFITTNPQRIKFIKGLAENLKGNTIIFFRRISHGKAIYDSLSEGHNTFFIDGSVKGEQRELIRNSIESEENARLVASLGTTSTGVSIRKLHHMISAAPSKAKIGVLQSIGRMLRQHSEKNHAVLYDIIDDLSWKSKRNYTLNHFMERVSIYDSENFTYSIFTVDLK